MKSWDDAAPLERAPKPLDKRRLLVCTLVAAVLLPWSLVTSGVSLPRFFERKGTGERQRSGGCGKQRSKPFTWDSIEASPELEFHPCFDDFECAKLQVPLDWFNGTHPNETVNVALAKLPARVPVDDPRYGGPILINPGGPGGSGVFLALMEAKPIQLIVDAGEDPESLLDKRSSDEKYFDIIGFDPRGIGATEPPARCFDDGAAWWSWRLREATEGTLDSSDAAVGRLWSMNHAYGGSCAKHMESEDGPDIKRYMTTASVSRDMLAIAEKHEELVAKKTAKLCQGKLKKCAESNIATSSKPDSVKLQYWGFSYGTYLGYTFASMYPDRVGRLVLDGVVNSDDYNEGLGNGSLHDAEKAMTSFYTFCLQSGPEECELATSASTVTDIETRVQNIVKSLYHNPLALDTLSGPEVLTYTDVKSILFGSLYSPQAVFPAIARLLVAIEAGSGEILDQLAMAYSYLHTYHCPINGTPFDMDVPEWAILCSDGDSQANETIADFEAYLHTLSTTSPTSGAIWSILRLKCIAWRIRAGHRWEGPFGANTSHPILFASNTADPVTPLKSGRIMHARFPGSGLMIQDSAGHCTLAEPVWCSMKHIRTYFQSGELPPPGTVCVPPASPFSLNSTDPGSIFYEPELGKGNGVVTYQDALDPDVRVEVLDAAHSVHRWLVENSFWPTTGSRRAHELLIGAMRDGF